MTPRLLIADHEPTLTEIRDAITRDGRLDVCAEAADAGEAIRLALETHPDVCLLDLMMPGGGLGAIREISTRLPATPVVVLTASEREADLFAALRQGAMGFLRKDMSFDKLPDALLSALRGEAAISRAMMARVIDQFREAGPRARLVDETSDAKLTGREWQVIGMLADGATTAEIGRRLGIQPSSVRVNIHAIVRKLDAEDRDDAVARYNALADDM